jgi:hypothetical protein
MFRKSGRYLQAMDSGSSDNAVIVKAEIQDDGSLLITDMINITAIQRDIEQRRERIARKLEV